MYISPFVFCAIIILVFIVIVLASLKLEHGQSSTSVLRGIISGAVMGKEKKPKGIKETNEFTRISRDPEITALTGGFAGFG